MTRHPLATILLPVVRPPVFLPNAIECALAQTVREFELFVVCDGAPRETIECAHMFARRDPRVKVEAFPKGERIGEAHLHTVLGRASGTFVAYLEDDDLWFPNHLAELASILSTSDFGNTIHVTTHPDQRIEALPCDLSDSRFRQRFLDEVFNRFGYSVCGHRIDAYRRLPEGWATTPLGMYPDLHMWRKFFRRGDFTFATRMMITAITVPGHVRGHMSLEERAREAKTWLSRVVNESERAQIVEAAWRSIISKEIQCEKDIEEMKSSQRELKAALAQMDAMHPGSLPQLQQTIHAQVAAEDELGKLKEDYNLSQHALSSWTDQLEIERKQHETATAAHRAQTSQLKKKIIELELAQKQSFRSLFRQLTRALRPSRED